MRPHCQLRKPCLPCLPGRGGLSEAVPPLALNICAKALSFIATLGKATKWPAIKCRSH